MPIPDGMTTTTVTQKKFWQSPDSTLLPPAAEGELIISRVRSIITVAAFSVAMVAAFRNPLSVDLRIYQAVLTLATALSLALHLLGRRVVYDWWVGFVASVSDVTLVSVGLAAFLIAGSPDLALNSTILFPAYFYALSVTSCLAVSGARGALLLRRRLAASRWPALVVPLDAWAVTLIAFIGASFLG